MDVRNCKQLDLFFDDDAYFSWKLHNDHELVIEAFSPDQDAPEDIAILSIEQAKMLKSFLMWAIP